MNRFEIVEIGTKFNMLTYIGYEQREKRKARLFRCDCGSVVEKQLFDVKNSKVPSCGCAKSKRAKQKFSTHSMSRTITYKSWSNMLTRCYNKNRKSYCDYGGRGIDVYQPWIDSFELFLLDMGERPSNDYSIERIDVNKGYYPDNCKWATQHEQSLNKRNTKTYVVSGEKYLLSELSEKFNVNPSVFRARIRNGETPEIAVINYIKRGSK
jgi:hypothetical protein